MSTMVRVKAFTLVELMTAITILVLLTVMVFLLLNNVRANSRDARRKSDIHLYRDALEHYRVLNGSFFVQYVPKPNESTPPCQPSTNITNCTGILGQSYGTMNLQNVGGTTYGGRKIADVLQLEGVIGTVALDPGNSNWDYIMLRCTLNGNQVTSGTNDDTVGVWTRLEKATLTQTDMETTVRSCGSSLDTGPNGATHDFGTGSSTDLPVPKTQSPNLTSLDEYTDKYMAVGTGTVPIGTYETSLTYP